MLKIEEYILQRKQEDKLDEFNLDKKVENIKSCVDYIFEYYNNYLNEENVSEKKIEEDEKLRKYRKQISQYDDEVAEWLVNIYQNHHNQKLNSVIGVALEKDYMFYLLHEEADFRALSYEIYPKLVKKYSYLKNDSEMIFKFIKDHYRVRKDSEIHIPYIAEKLNKWVENTNKQYNVNIEKFVFKYLNKFSDNEHMWPRTHKIRVRDNQGIMRTQYDYTKTNNLFNIDNLYIKISDKPFIKGKRKLLEILMIYVWLREFDGDQEYFDKYLNRVLGNKAE